MSISGISGIRPQKRVANTNPIAGLAEVSAVGRVKFRPVQVSRSNHAKNFTSIKDLEAGWDKAIKSEKKTRTGTYIICAL